MKNELLCMGLLAVAGMNPAQSMAKDKAEQAEKKNVLFIMVDDLRPQLGCYGQTQIKSPNIDKLASEGTLFRKAYCNYPVCGPSRASLLSGLRPNATRYINNQSSVEKDEPNIVPIQKAFKDNGYYTVSLGKVYHHRFDMVEGWTERPWHATDGEKRKDHPDGWRDYQDKDNLALCRDNKGRANSFEIGVVNDEDYFDGKIANRAIEKLKKFKKSGQPFFMTVGFIKPHLPFNAPKKYFDLYPKNSIELPTNYYAPENAPEQSLHNWWELRAYHDIPSKEGNLTDEKAKEVIRGYYACVSYVDAMVGKVLDKLKELNLDENTVVCLIGDHGWQLGEHSLWCKHSNFNKALNTTMIVKAPGMKGGHETNSLVELIDLYPSFCDLTGIDAPDHLEGKSFVPVLKNPKKKWKEVVYSKMGDGWTAITQQYIYTEWKNKKGETTERMLFDHKNDPEENVNVVDQVKMKKVVAKMSKLLDLYVEAE
ncbi:sulfatase [Marinifilum fragile]|uniref:sulfatase n=1 Tax=Marinifilum fragile TaxID=570161 RepID=UPI002AA825DC|nr:sulfatase [Marinifilum fragile]